MDTFNMDDPMMLHQQGRLYVAMSNGQTVRTTRNPAAAAKFTHAMAATVADHLNSLGFGAWELVDLSEWRGATKP